MRFAKVVIAVTSIICGGLMAQDCDRLSFSACGRCSGQSLCIFRMYGLYLDSMAPKWDYVDYSIGGTDNMSSRVLIPFGMMLLVQSVGAQGRSGCVEEPLRATVHVQARYANLLRGLWDLGFKAGVCIGFEVGEPALLGGTVDGPVAGAAGDIVRQWLRTSRGYCVASQGRILSVRPCNRAPRTWLDYRIRTLKAEHEISVQDGSNLLYMSVLDQLRPGKGHGGHYLSGVLADRIGPYDLHDKSVREILNRFTGDSHGALWVTLKPYSRLVAADLFWRIIEYEERPASVEGSIALLERAIPDAFSPHR